MKAKEIKMDPALVSRFYAHDRTLYRRRSDGSFKVIETLNGGRLVTVFDGERIDAAAVVWCLHYGNWPKYHLAVVDGDPHNLDLSNVFPVFINALRYAERPVGKRFGHSLDLLASFSTPAECRLNWNRHAIDRYRKSLAQVLAEEKRERELRDASDWVAPGRADWEQRQAERKVALKSRLQGREGFRHPRPGKPEAAEGRMWVWHDKAWAETWLPVHVSDDHRMRLAAAEKGAVRSEYQPAHGETWYFDAAGVVVTA